ncbi:MAG: twin-arginine translocase TatA/TatE family subunit [Planctomycetaceae bacterium]|jgi:sec-independent protein translocase protein TatA|nr:twin-arginine translocase TatA/TatE family subunit [Planctomycetaceae bacterium]
MNMLLAFGMPGLPEMLIIGGIFILFFGSTKLPGLARSIGKSANEFKKGIRDDSPIDDDDDEGDDEDEGDSGDDGDDVDDE